MSVSLQEHSTYVPRHAADSKHFLPSPPTDRERDMYVHRYKYALIIPSAISIACLIISMVRFATTEPWLYPLITIPAVWLIYWVISVVVTGPSRSFSLDQHNKLVESWWKRPWVKIDDGNSSTSRFAYRVPSIDIFLPICGEDTLMLKNTWVYVRELTYAYKLAGGKINVFVLDDRKSPAARKLAAQFGYTYITRENNEYQKAGNLRNAFAITEQSSNAGEYILIFDADFCPRSDMLRHMVPYLATRQDIAILQSPQHFRVERRSQGWLQRGAGSVQELFYRYVQPSRQYHNAAICVGTNALYRRSALRKNGGSTLIGHSEDVHTGFDMMRKGYRVQYIPVNLASGACPSELPAFLAQQYRWCMGSMSLLGDKKFWQLKLSFQARCGFFSGFCYYITTALMTIVGLVVPLLLLTVYPHLVALDNYILIIPSLVYSLVLFPAWHRSPHGLAALSTRFLYGWAHLFAILDVLRGTAKAWSPTGAAGTNKSTKVVLLQNLLVWGTIVSGGGAVTWVGLAAWRMVSGGRWYDFAPMLALGLLYAAICGLALGSAWATKFRSVAAKRQDARLHAELASVTALRPTVEASA